jgi:hypothetical protein
MNSYSDQKVSDFIHVQSEISRYRDIEAVYGRLADSGYLTRIYDLLKEIYTEEKEFTMNQLAKRTASLESDLESHFQSNSVLFRCNLQLILNGLVDRIWSPAAIPLTQNRFQREISQLPQSKVVPPPQNSKENFVTQARPSFTTTIGELKASMLEQIAKETEAERIIEAINTKNLLKNRQVNQVPLSPTTKQKGERLSVAKSGTPLQSNQSPVPVYSFHHSHY